MKNSILILSFCLFIITSSFCQIISGNTNIQIPCCMNKDSVDIDNDGNYELKIESAYFGTLLAYTATSPNESDLCGPMPINRTVDIYSGCNPSGIMLAGDMGNMGWDLGIMKPNEGSKYLGFVKINSPADTTFGWIEIDFRGGINGNPTQDAMFILSYGYNTTSNEHIQTGQTSVSSINEININNTFVLSPNPANNNLYVSSEKILKKITVYDITGKKVIEIKQNTSSVNIDISSFNPGIYFIKVDDGNSFYQKKFIKL